MASQEGEAIAKRAPYVDLIFGPQTLHRLPEMMETKEIKSINLVSAAKILGLMYTALGLIIWLLFACFGLLQFVGLAAFFEGQDLGFLGAGIGGLVISLIVGLCLFPIMYGVIGAIAGAIGAALYNLIAGWIGGLEVQVSTSSKY